VKFCDGLVAESICVHVQGLQRWQSLHSSSKQPASRIAYVVVRQVDVRQMNQAVDKLFSPPLNSLCHRRAAVVADAVALQKQGLKALVAAKRLHERYAPCI
jgi:hypothetical protein